MKQITLLIALLVCAVFACNEAVEAPTSATISGTITNPGETEKIEVLYSPMIGDRTTLAESEIAEDGTFSLTLETTDPMAARLRIGRETSSIYVTPGDALNVTVDAEEFDETITYEGEGALVNNYYASKYLKEEQYNEGLEEKNIYTLEQEEFLATHNGLHEVLMGHFNSTFNGQDISEDFMKMEEIDIVADWASTMANYESAHAYYAKKEDFKVDEGFNAFREKIDINDPTGLQSAAFRGYLSSQTRSHMDAVMEEDSTLEGDWPKLYRAAYERVAADESFTGKVKEYIQASQINDYISYFGTDGVKDMLDGFKSANTESEFLPALDENYALWAKIAKGQPAPDFTYASIDGEQVSFSDFRGKVVYLDVWATWCGPCKAEMPHAKTLKKKYADNSSVVFMYVSVDEDKEKWEKFLADDPEFEGVHLITGTGWKSDLTDAYMIKGIPRYILVDQNGNIVNSSAPRPSSGEKLEGMINDLLDNEVSGG